MLPNYKCVEVFEPCACPGDWLIVAHFQVSFIELGTIITNGKKLQSYIVTYNATWTYVGDDIFLEATNTTLVGGVMTVRIRSVLWSA